VTDEVRVRFAPSPTGALHIGGARTAIYNWALARREGGTFVLRIDDTDPERSTPENTAQILRSLRWLGLDWDEGPEVGGEHGPYFQTQRTANYDAALQHLKVAGAVYPCFCTAEELQAKREAAQKQGGYAGYDRACRCLPPDVVETRIAAGEGHAWRIAVPEDRGDVTFVDAVRGETSFPATALDDFIVVRSDGSPTYNFATVVDDVDMLITHVVRGDDHLANTPRQIIVYEALGAPVPTFAHLSMIWGPDGKKLSKRQGAASVEDYRDRGYVPEALLNYLALLGWSLDGETTIIPVDVLIANFSLDRISKNPAVFDAEKLEWMNGVYLRDMPVGEFLDRMVPWLESEGLLSADAVEGHRDWLLRLPPLVQERVKHLDEVVPMVRFLFGEPNIDAAAQEKVLEAPGAGAALDAARDALAQVERFEHAAIEGALREVPARIGAKPKVVFQTVRVAATGSTVSPPLFESLELLGRNESLARLDKARAIAAD
jgi:glutamyl-tRNA synthetase